MINQKDFSRKAFQIRVGKQLLELAAKELEPSLIRLEAFVGDKQLLPGEQATGLKQGLEIVLQVETQAIVGIGFGSEIVEHWLGLVALELGGDVVVLAHQVEHIVPPEEIQGHRLLISQLLVEWRVHGIQTYHTRTTPRRSTADRAVGPAEQKLADMRPQIPNGLRDGQTIQALFALDCRSDVRLKLIDKRCW